MDDDKSREAQPAEVGRLTGATSTLAVAAEDPDVDPCDLACDAMPGLVLGDLTQNDKRWVIHHTETCNYCSNKLGGYQKIDHMLDRIDEDCCSASPPQPKLPTSRRAAYGQIDSPV